MSAQVFFVFFTFHAFDRQTDISLVAKTALHRCSAVTKIAAGRHILSLSGSHLQICFLCSSVFLYPLDNIIESTLIYTTAAYPFNSGALHARKSV